MHHGITHWDAKKAKGSKVHAVADAIGHLLSPRAAPANEQPKARAEQLTRALQDATGKNLKLAAMNQGCTREQPAAPAAEHGPMLEVVKQRPGVLPLCRVHHAQVPIPPPQN